MSRITSVRVRPIDLELASPFVISLGTREAARNLLVRVETTDGTVGYGEASPLPPITGITRDGALAVAREAGSLVEGRATDDYRSIGDSLHDAFPRTVAGTLPVEMAVIDAYCREYRLPLSALFGGQPAPIRTDLTVSLVEPPEAREAAVEAANEGYSELKVKTGDTVEASVARVEAVHNGHPEATLRVDANQGWGPTEAVRFCDELQSRGIAIDLLEQPVPATDISGMAAVRRQVRVPVGADESVFTPADALRVVRQDAADVINVKLVKSGLLGARRIASIASAADRELMVGCMLESALGLHASAHVVTGIGEFSYIDLDGNTGMTDGIGGPEPSPVIDPSGPGHGIVPGVDWGDD